MHILIPQERFAATLSRAQSVLERKTTRPILENVLIEAEQGKLRLSSTDLRVSLTQEVECRVERPGSVAIPGRKLYEITREMPRQEISVEAKENQWITVTSGKSNFHLPGSPADEYPGLPSAPESFLSMEAALFGQMLDKTLFAASSDESRMYLCGVFVQALLEEEKRIFRMVATDGHRLSLVDRPLSQEMAPFAEGVIVPKKGLIELKGLLEGVSGEFQIAASEGRLFAQVDSTSLAVTLIEGSFPRYNQVIPAEASQSIRLNRIQFVDALRRVSLLSDQETHSVMLENQGEVVVLTSTNPQLGDAREEIEVHEAGDVTKMAFNANYFLDALRAADGDVVELALSEPLAPCLIRSMSDPGFLAVVMPMRLD